MTNYALEILNRALELFHCALFSKMPPNLMIKRERWEKPSSGWMKLNMDGSAESSGITGGGGLVRDDNGTWVFDFARNIGNASSFTAELWALHDGLRLCLSRNILVVEADAKSIVELLTNHHHPNLSKSTLLDDCKQLITLFHQVRVCHCFREANRYADLLARTGTLLDQDFITFESPPEGIVPIFNSDCNGLYLNRRCPMAASVR